jgi:hypothetical protein
MALGISALGKKRHRVEFARQLVVGCLLGNFEKHKEIFCPADDTSGKALLRVLDSSLPWWAERDTWGRWTTKHSVESEMKSVTNIPVSANGPKFTLASSDRMSEYQDMDLPMTLSQVVEMLLNDRQNSASNRQFRITAT